MDKMFASLILNSEKDTIVIASLDQSEEATEKLCQQRFPDVPHITIETTSPASYFIIEKWLVESGVPEKSCEKMINIAGAYLASLITEVITQMQSVDFYQKIMPQKSCAEVMKYKVSFQGN
jgi:hypothetical protein